MAAAISTTTFSQALSLCTDGYPIRRQSWAEGASVILRKGLVLSNVSDDFISAVPRSLFDVSSGQVRMPTLVLTDASGFEKPDWRPETLDLIAADWIALDQPIIDDEKIDARPLV